MFKIQLLNYKPAQGIGQGRTLAPEALKTAAARFCSRF
jgi:hypothetical protein